MTELLRANTELRENVEKVERDLDNKDAENTQLNIENQQLRERLELVEGILKANSHHLESMLSQQTKTHLAMSNTEHGRFGHKTSNMASAAQTGQATRQPSAQAIDSSELSPEQPAKVDEVYNELIHMRKMNRVLGQRIKQLEVQNFHMTAQGFNKGGFKQGEPSRPMFSGGYDGESPRRYNSYDHNRQDTFETPAHN